MSQDQIHDSNTIPFTMIPHEVVRDNATFGDIYEKMVYFILKSHAVNGTGAFPSYATIAKEAQCSKRKAIDAVQSLVDRNLISKKTRVDRMGDQTSNIYTINHFVRGAQDALGVVQEMHWGSAQGAPGVVQEMHPKNNPIKNNPLSNSSSSEGVSNHSDDLSKLVSFFQKEIGLASSYVIDDIQHTLNDTSYELIQYALEQSVLNDVRNWKYAKAIIRKLAEKKLFTLEAIQLHEAKRSNSKAPKGYGRNRRSHSKMKEPAWLAKEKEDQQAFEQRRKQELESNVPDDAEVEELLRSLHQD
ncbi:helix-turn-helix domain-containing protein [Exiguobacterium sp. s191]|uniref:helix-turn-helix domain-containing protein n=1 Tax=Exiguobacterium sp. s191 TaxID=2751196 RepID=UPI001BE67982|nr:helix-turn-helix domain-containing protein [Exiguobacterium sp. s191]